MRERSRVWSEFPGPGRRPRDGFHPLSGRSGLACTLGGVGAIRSPQVLKVRLCLAEAFRDSPLGRTPGGVMGSAARSEL